MHTHTLHPNITFYRISISFQYPSTKICCPSSKSTYPRSWDGLHGLLLPHLLHGGVVLLLVLRHKHFKGTPCVQEKRLARCQQKGQRRSIRVLGKNKGILKGGGPKMQVKQIGNNSVLNTNSESLCILESIAMRKQSIANYTKFVSIWPLRCWWQNH